MPGVARQGLMSMPAATGVARVNRERLWLALTHDVTKHLLNTLFVKALMLPKRHDITQQRGMVDGATLVLDVHAAPVGLARDGTV